MLFPLRGGPQKPSITRRKSSQKYGEITHVTSFIFGQFRPLEVKNNSNDRGSELDVPRLSRSLLTSEGWLVGILGPKNRNLKLLQLIKVVDSKIKLQSPLLRPVPRCKSWKSHEFKKETALGHKKKSTVKFSTGNLNIAPLQIHVVTSTSLFQSFPQLVSPS